VSAIPHLEKGYLRATCLEKTTRVPSPTSEDLQGEAMLSHLTGNCPGRAPAPGGPGGEKEPVADLRGPTRRIDSLNVGNRRPERCHGTSGEAPGYREQSAELGGAATGKLPCQSTSPSSLPRTLDRTRILPSGASALQAGSARRPLLQNGNCACSESPREHSAVHTEYSICFPGNIRSRRTRPMSAAFTCADSRQTHTASSMINFAGRFSIPLSSFGEGVVSWKE
jgi:hypothetical protein